MTPDLSLSDIPQFLGQHRHERFYGRVSFDFRDGEVTLIRTERTQLVNPKSNHLSLGVNHEHQSDISKRN
jgi:hypothetical protein